MGGMPMGMPMGGGPIPKKPAAKGAAPPVGRPPRPAAAASEADESPPPSLGGSIKPPASKVCFLLSPHNDGDEHFCVRFILRTKLVHYGGPKRGIFV